MGIAIMQPVETSMRQDEALALNRQEQDLYDAIPAEVDYMSHPSFSLPFAEERFFGPNAQQVVSSDWAAFPEVSEDTQMTAGRKIGLKPKDEEFLFLRYNYASYRLSKLIVAQKRNFSTVRARQMILWFRRSQRDRSTIVSANMALVLAMAKRTKIPNIDFTDMISEGNMALLRSVEKFDVSRGFKFSTYACRSILKSFNRLATRTANYRRHFPTDFKPEMERSDYDVRKHEIQLGSSVDTLREILSKNRAALTDIERTVVLQRFAIGAAGGKKTLSQVGKLIGLTNERVRQIQNNAICKLRVALNREYLAA